MEFKSDDKKSDIVSVAKVEKYVKTECGYGKCTPKWLQPCASPNMLLIALCLFSGVSIYVNMGLVNISLATWERRYQMTSSQTAWIIASSELMSAVTGPIVGYLAAFWHKGRMVSFAALMMVVGNVIYLIPQFASGPYTLGSSLIGGVCDGANTGNLTKYDPCNEEITDQNMSMWIGVFILAQLCYAVSGSILWTVGITYLDDNSKHENMPMNFGIFAGSAALGATLGFIGGGLSLEVYVDVAKVDMDTIDIDSSDPRWVGAWWIGFLAALFASIPLLVILPCFPKELPAAAEFRKLKTSKAYKGKGEEEMDREDFGKSAQDLKLTLKTLFSNPIFVLVMIAGILELGAVTAFAAFLPKVLQFQFGLTPSTAALVAGVVLVPGAIIGQLLGGLIAKCNNLGVKGILWMVAIAAYICVFTSAGFLARCDMAPLAGYNSEYPINTTATFEDDFTQPCNADCNCTTLVYEPICDTDGISYFSPCHGGCTSEILLEDGITTMYGNCSCMANSSVPMWYQAEENICPTDCPQFYVFVPIFLLMIICTFVQSTGGYSTTMRVVPEKQRAFAFGVQSPIIKLLGTVPIPILFGYIFDLSCEVWQDNCGEQGSCWIYNSNTIALGLFIGGIVVKSISGTLFMTCAIIYKPPEKEEVEIKYSEFDKKYMANGYDNEAWKIDPVDIFHHTSKM